MLTADEVMISCPSCGAAVGVGEGSGEVDASTGRRYCFECGEELPAEGATR